MHTNKRTHTTTQIHMYTRSHFHPHVHIGTRRRKMSCPFIQSQSRCMSAANANWRAAVGKHKTHFLALTTFHRFGRFPFSLCVSWLLPFCLTRDELSSVLLRSPGLDGKSMCLAFVYSLDKGNMGFHVQFCTPRAVTK